jgi:hypothetical protein
MDARSHRLLRQNQRFGRKHLLPPGIRYVFFRDLSRKLQKDLLG